MLNDTEKHLIVAAVDGGFDSHQESEFRRLLADSAEAASLYRHLLADRDRLRSLRRIPAPAGLAAHVQERALRSLRVEPARPVAPARAGWVPYAVAASVFLAVAAGSFWLTSIRSPDQEPAERLALPRSTPQPGVRPELATSPPIESLPPPRTSQPALGKPQDNGALALVPARPASLEPAPSPRPFGSSEVVGSRPTGEAPDLNPAQVRVPLLAGVADFDRPDIKARLLDDLTREPAHRLDLFVRDPHRAAELVQAAARATGVAVSVDHFAQERMKRKLPSAWLVYTESLTAEEIVALLGQLAVQTRNDKSPVLVTGHLVPAQSAESRDLRDLVGVDVGPWKRPKAAAPKSIASGTVDQLSEKLSKTAGQKTAILVTYVPLGHRSPLIVTKELKSFLEHREVRKSNAVPLLIVIRPAA